MVLAIVIVAVVGLLALLGLADRRAKARGHATRSAGSIGRRTRDGKRDARVVNTVAGALQKDVSWTEAARRDRDADEQAGS